MEIPGRFPATENAGPTNHEVIYDYAPVELHADSLDDVKLNTTRQKSKSGTEDIADEPYFLFFFYTAILPNHTVYYISVYFPTDMN